MKRDIIQAQILGDPAENATDGEQREVRDIAMDLELAFSGPNSS